MLSFFRIRNSCTRNIDRYTDSIVSTEGRRGEGALREKERKREGRIERIRGRRGLPLSSGEEAREGKE